MQTNSSSISSPNDYSNLFVVSIVISTITGMFSKYISTMVSKTISWFMSHLIIETVIKQQTNPEFYKDILNFVEKQNLNSNKNMVINNGENILPLLNMFVFKKIWVWIDIKFSNRDDAGEITFKFLFNFRIDKRFHNIKRMVMDLAKKKEKYDTVKTIKINKYDRSSYRNSWKLFKEIPCHPQKVYFPENLVESIEESVENFFGSKKMYIENGMPYRKNILFTGNPGNGKTSMIRYLAIKFEKPIYILDFDTINSDRDRRIITDKPGFVVLEDFDRYIRSLKTEKINNPDISKILNFMDGFESPENVITIITVNSIEDLPPVIFRPGRITEKYEFPMLTEEVFNKIKDDYDLNENFEQNTHSEKSVADFLIPLIYKKLGP